MRSKKSVIAIPSCKVCHRKIEQNSLFSLIFAEKTICIRCYFALKPHWVTRRFGKVKIHWLYPYGEAFQNLLYLYKGCGDIELSTVFLERIKPYLKLRYSHHVIVPAPSSEKRIGERGYDHVPLIFQGIGKGVVPAIVKTSDVKQSDQNKEGRKRIGDYLALLPKVKISGERVLFVDDVMTTGSTVRACLRLLRKLHPKSIEVFVLAKVGKKDRATIS